MQANIQGVEIISTKEFFDNRGSFNKLFSIFDFLNKLQEDKIITKKNNVICDLFIF